MNPNEYPMRQPCPKCGSMIGVINTRSGQDCVFCKTCGAWNYNAPRSETGKEHVITERKVNLEIRRLVKEKALKTKKCEECEAEMVFLENPKTGKKVPVDVDSLSEEDVELLEREEEVSYRGGEHVSHFLTCTNPRRFSKK